MYNGLKLNLKNDDHVVLKKYLSENFVKGKVLAVILHKDGIPTAIKKQL